MRWFSFPLRSLFFSSSSKQQNVTRRFSEHADKKYELRENPFFEKYADKIAEVQKTHPEDFKNLLEKNLNTIQHDCNLLKLHNSKTETIDKKNVKGSHFRKLKDLNQIMKTDAVQEKTAEEIKSIWKQYHQIKDGIYAVLPGESFEKMHLNLKKYPLFLFPLPRAEGYEFILCQYLDHSCYFTSLLNYQAFKENAPVCLTVTYFTEFLLDKGIVLMRGEYDNNALKAHEAQCLTNQLQLYYGNNDKEKLQLLEKFNMHPDSFKHMDLIANFEYGFGK